MIKRKFVFASLLFVALSAVQVKAQVVVARIPGLESNNEYMSLLRSDMGLRMRSDSLMSVLRDVRSQIGRNAEATDSLAQMRNDSMVVVLTDVENAIIAMRTQKIKLIDQINAIEQQHVLSSMGNIDAASSQASGSIFANEYFRNCINAGDFDTLLEMNARESAVYNSAQKYVTNYNDIKTLYDKYVQARTEAEAEDIYAEMSVAMDENMDLERQLADEWSNIYDQKTYVYSYFFEKENRDDILELTENLTSEAQQEKLLSIDNLASEALADYRLQKSVVLNYEIYVAKLLNLTTAIDSLSTASRNVRQLDYRLAKIDVERRSFVNYEPIEFVQRTPYNSANPIPECVVYEYGTIYRILMGTYKYQQAVSIFRNATPLCVETLEDGRFAYYAGGFRTLSEAETAVEVMKKKGFRNPKIVEWCDGQKTNISDAGGVSFRININGELNDAVREVISTMAVDSQLSRISEQSFIVGMFASRAMAERVMAAIQKSDETLSVEIEELRPEEEDEE